MRAKYLSPLRLALHLASFVQCRESFPLARLRRGRARLPDTYLPLLGGSAVDTVRTTKLLQVALPVGSFALRGFMFGGFLRLPPGATMPEHGVTDAGWLWGLQTYNFIGGPREGDSHYGLLQPLE